MDVDTVSITSTGVDRLSNELLALVFLHLDAPTSFSLTCKAWRAISCDPLNVALYHLHHGGRIGALTLALGTKTLTPTVFDVLLGQKAIWTISMYTILFGVYRGLPSLIPETSFLPPKWGKKDVCVTDETILRIVTVATENKWGPELYDFVPLDALVGILHDVTADRPGFRVPVVTDTARLEVMLADVEEALASKRWVPIPGDPINRLVARTAYLEPKLIPWLAEAGWHHTDEDRDQLLTSLLTSVEPPPLPANVLWETLLDGNIASQTRREIVFRSIRKYHKLSGGLFEISATVCAKLMCNQEMLPLVLELPSYLNSGIPGLENDVLHFSLNALAADVLYFAHNTYSTLSNPKWIKALYENFVRRDSVLRNDMTLCGLYHLACSVQPADVPTHHSRRGKDGERPIAGLVASRIDTKQNVRRFSKAQMTEALVEVLCSEFLVSPEQVLLAHASSDVFDLSEVARLAVVRMLRMPSKGATLLALAIRYPFLVSHIRTTLLSHRISLALLQPTPADPSRPIFNPFPSFVSPIAFDYMNVADRYPLGLGPNPWVEDCYEISRKEDEGGKRFAQSVWPLKEVNYSYISREDKDKAVPLGKLTGQSTVSGESLSPWVYERTPKHGSLPVAIALLELFEPHDEVLDIVLMHAILNMNPGITAFFLKHGVPLHEHHLEAADKSGLPRLEAINQHLLEKAAAKAIEVRVAAIEVISKPKRVRKRGKGKAGAKAMEVEVTS
ncbi:hypothetical protein P7C70_g1774, partial [Phenoliferia sp. Uapishka_3]